MADAAWWRRGLEWQDGEGRARETRRDVFRHGLPAGTHGINFGTSGGRWNPRLAGHTLGGGGTIQKSIPTDGVITIYAK